MARTTTDSIATSLKGGRHPDGGLIGSWSDLFDLGVGRDFLDKVSRELMPGRTAVVSEVEEDWVTALDTRVEAIGGTVLRPAGHWPGQGRPHQPAADNP
jgi:hypothetical protein